MTKVAKQVLQKTTLQKKAMLAALTKTFGIVTTACKIVQIERSTHYDWLKSDPKYAEEVKELDNVSFDFVESKLYKNIDKCDTASIIFFLKTKGRKRGYFEDTKITDNSEKIITIIHELRKKND